jgi:hypothetical protein
MSHKEVSRSCWADMRLKKCVLEHSVKRGVGDEDPRSGQLMERKGH